MVSSGAKIPQDSLNILATCHECSPFCGAFPAPRVTNDVAPFPFLSFSAVTLMDSLCSVHLCPAGASYCHHCVVFKPSLTYYDICPCRTSCPPPAAGHWATFTPLTGLLYTLLFLPLDSSSYLTKLRRRSFTLSLHLSLTFSLR